MIDDLLRYTSRGLSHLYSLAKTCVTLAVFTITQTKTARAQRCQRPHMARQYRDEVDMRSSIRIWARVVQTPTPSAVDAFVPGFLNRVTVRGPVLRYQNGQGRSGRELYSAPSSRYKVHLGTCTSNQNKDAADKTSIMVREIVRLRLGHVMIP